MPCSGAPSSQTQPLSFVSGNITQVLSNQSSAVQIMVFFHQFIEARLLVRLNQAHAQMIQDLLLLRGWTTKSNGGFFVGKSSEPRLFGLARYPWSSVAGGTCCPGRNGSNGWLPGMG